ncbi:MAG: Gfo/Idh/MocA family oxidoreductase [Ardenticatenaceae bacterium]|nr:Gfo/Idh/MocA family oxidoreductase [Ardenticatenaceae bacterium]MCB8946764.1 Gfo/Idh/MocA family oxidoreductase [Ardenticatenaceae bacterium]
MITLPTIRFGVIGVNHGHIYGMVQALVEAGAELAAFYAKEPELVAQFQAQYPDVPLARTPEEILDDDSIQLIASSIIPNERAPLGIEAMQRGKDYFVDKAGFTSLEQLAEVKRVQAETNRIYSVFYGERFENAATVKAGELVKAGAIGKVLQTVGLGPHRMHPNGRPDWFFKKAQYGGILTDIAAHQMDQFLYFTGSTEAQVVAAQVGNFHHPQYPELEDFGDALLRGNGGLGYVRVDWFTPEGSAVWGDTRLTILGTDGTIEVRKNVDIGGQPGPNHLFLIDQDGTYRIPCDDVELSFGRRFLSDVVNRTETAMTQAHCFLASELALTAQAQAARLGGLSDETI